MGSAMHRIGFALDTILRLKLEVLLLIVFMQTSHHGLEEILNSRIWLPLSPYHPGFKRQWANSYIPPGLQSQVSKERRGFFLLLIKVVEDAIPSFGLVSRYSWTNLTISLYLLTTWSIFLHSLKLPLPYYSSLLFNWTIYPLGVNLF